jgi:phosphatidate cytidylyltransferase
VLLPRIVSAVILGPLFLGLVWLGWPWFDLLIAAIAAVMASEFARMDGREGAKRRMLIRAGCVAAVGVMSLAGAVPALVVVFLASLAVAAADQAAGRRGFALTQAAVPYVALPALAMLFVRAQEMTGPDRGLSLFWLLAVVWGTDIGAYAFGRLIGGPKLAPAISPKKTWAGAIGGLGCGVAASAAVQAGFGVPVAPAALVVAAAASVAAEAGDLLESALKRWYEVKDSGTLIPGHGGLMDRFDGLWAAAPVVALACWLLGGVRQW